MLIKQIQLDPKDENVYLDVYVSDKIGDFVRNAILVIPGGGYGCVCSDREGEPIAQAFIPYGYNAFVLHYTVDGSKHFPAQLIQASAAMKHIKDHAEEYNIDPDKVFVTGFSAGGHLAGSLGILWDNPKIYDAIDMPYGYNKPKGMMLVYPVISAFAPVTHEGSIQNLLRTDPLTNEGREAVSLEKHVSEKSAPAFIVHTANDGLVPVRNSIDLAGAYADAGLTFELHIYPDAPHGVALGNKITAMHEPKFDNPCIAQWVSNAATWAENL